MLHDKMVVLLGAIKTRKVFPGYGQAFKILCTSIPAENLPGRDTKDIVNDGKECRCNVGILFDETKSTCYVVIPEVNLCIGVGDAEIPNTGKVPYKGRPVPNRWLVGGRRPQVGT